MEDAMVTPTVQASRQKSCNSCVQSKRRCDRQTPVCTRCAEKKNTCVYGKEPEMEGGAFANSATSPFPADSLLHVDYLGSTQMGACLDAVTESVPSTVLDTVGGCHTDMNRFLDWDWMGEDGAANGHQWLVQAGLGIAVDRLSTPADEEIYRNYKKMNNLCEHYEPWQLYDPKKPVHYLVHRIKAFPVDLATRSAAPFMHRYLYRDHVPLCILSCFSTSVLYANRTPANAAVVLRALQQSTGELLGAAAEGVIATPTEKLAKTQSLFLYQVIRLFDGDIALRAQAEKDMVLLETWLRDLCRIRENLGGLSRLEDFRMSEQPPKEWERWIFAESVRRTIFIAYSVIALYGMMKDTEISDDPGPWAYVHRWTLSRHLWEADSSFIFYRMWEEKPHFIINNYSLEHFVKHGRGDDVDEFAEIMLNAYLGTDETKEFLTQK